MVTTLDTSIAKTSLAAVKRQANIASGDVTYDDRLTEYINIASEQITTRLNRELVATDYVQWLDGRGEGEFALPQYPAVRVNMLATGRSSAMTVQYTGSDTRATVQVTTTGLRLTSWGVSGITTFEPAWSDYETVSEVVTEVDDNLAGWTATLISDNPSKWLSPQGGRDAKTAAIDLYAPDCFDHEYEINRNSGLIRFHGWHGDLGHHASSMRVTHGMGMGAAFLGGTAPFGGLAVLADYRAGYEIIPADIEQVARDMAVTMFRASYRDGSVKSENLGGYSYTLADQSADNAKYDTVLGKYTREVIA